MRGGHAERKGEVGSGKVTEVGGSKGEEGVGNRRRKTEEGRRWTSSEGSRHLLFIPTWWSRKRKMFYEGVINPHLANRSTCSEVQGPRRPVTLARFFLKAAYRGSDPSPLVTAQHLRLLCLLFPEPRVDYNG